jgi:ACS family tartrate transporter-like MFS transporter
MDGAIEKSAVRKVYMRLLPFAILRYFPAFIDRITVSFAGLRMRGDLDMSVTAYGSWYRGKAGAMSASLNRRR